MTDVARRYAKAAVDLAAASGDSSAVDRLSADMVALRDAVVGSEHLREVLANPAFKAARLSVLTAVMQKLGVSDITSRLVRLLLDKERIADLADVASAIEVIADERAGRLRAQVSSAVVLTEAQKDRIAKALEKRLGHRVLISTDIRPELLGGLVCRVGDLTFDSSLKRQLELLREQLDVGL